MTYETVKKGTQEDKNVWGCLWSPPKMMRGEAVILTSVTLQLNATFYAWEGVAARELQHWAGCDGGTFTFVYTVLPGAHW